MFGTKSWIISLSLLLVGFTPDQRRGLQDCAHALLYETDGDSVASAGPVSEVLAALADKPAGLVADVLVIGVIESGLTRGRRGAAGEVGTFQLMPATAAWAAQHCGIRGEWTRPGVNARLAYCYYNDLLLQAGGDMQAAVAAYNYGPKAIRIVREYGTLPKITANYLVKHIRLRERACGKY